VPNNEELGLTAEVTTIRAAVLRNPDRFGTVIPNWFGNGSGSGDNPYRVIG
jgi:hypothetical protein